MKSVRRWGSIRRPLSKLRILRKKNGYKRSVELSEEHGMYRQDYCGCVFSRRQREEEIAAREQRNREQGGQKT